MFRRLLDYTGAMSDARSDEQELEYYRAIEDFFAALRGVPHTLSPKDFQLLRSWWRERVPLAAVRAGINEAVARRRERGEETPVVSLSYCRHAVRAQARRLAAAHVGEADASAEAAPAGAAVEELARHLEDAAGRQEAPRPRVAAVLRAVAGQVGALAGRPAAEAEEQLFALETSLLAACREALADDESADLAEDARSAAGAGAGDTAVAAHRDRLLRQRLGLPRLELP